MKQEENLEGHTEERVSDLPSNVVNIGKFLEDGRQCCQKGCLRKLYASYREELSRFGDDLRRSTRDAKEAALLMNLREHLYKSRYVRSGEKRKRQRVAYSVSPFGSMCRKAYIMLWDIGEAAFKNIMTHMKNNSNTFCPKVHGLSGSTSNIALSPDIHQKVICFIIDIGESIGEESEGRQGRRDIHTVKYRVVCFLPASYSIAILYRQFIAEYRRKNSQEENSTPLSLSSFRSIFYSEPCKHIRIRSPRSNICDECAMFRSFYRQTTEQETKIPSTVEEEHINSWQHHVQLAKEARLVYNEDLQRARETLALLRKGKLQLNGYVAHYTFDFMQSLAIPQFADKTKEMYYFSLRNIHLFSIRDDGDKKQYNYLYDEGDGGKGANYVISMLFHFLTHRKQGTAAIVIHLHADNCCGQNKNNMVMQFFVLLVSIGFLKHVEMKFLVKGHTHCSVDGGHGIIKKEWRRRNVFTIEQAAKVVEESSPTAGMHYATILKANGFFNWDKILSKYFRKLPNILSFQYFEMDSARSGILRYRRHHNNSWLEMQILKQDTDAEPFKFSSLESIQEALIQIAPPGIPKKKQRVLYEKVRKYVPVEYQDTICPMPEDYHQQKKISKNHTIKQKP